MDQILQLTIKIASFTLIFLLVRWTQNNLPKWFPASEQKEEPRQEPQINILGSNPKTLEVIIYILYLIFIIVGAMGIFFFLMYIHTYFLLETVFTHNDLFITPYGFGWIPMMPAGLLVSALFFDMVLELILKVVSRITGKSRKALLPTLGRTDSPFNIDEKKLKGFLLSLIVFLCVATLPGIFSYTYFSQTNIKHRPWPGITTKEYKYSEIKAIWYIEFYQNKVTGDIKPTAKHYVIELKDGTKWTTTSIPPKFIFTKLSGNSDMVKEAIEAIAKKSNLSIKTGIYNRDI